MLAMRDRQRMSVRFVPAFAGEPGTVVHEKIRPVFAKLLEPGDFRIDIRRTRRAKFAKPISGLVHPPRFGRIGCRIAPRGQRRVQGQRHAVFFLDPTHEILLRAQTILAPDVRTEIGVPARIEIQTAAAQFAALFGFDFHVFACIEFFSIFGVVLHRSRTSTGRRQTPSPEFIVVEFVPMHRRIEILGQAMPLRYGISMKGRVGFAPIAVEDLIARFAERERLFRLPTVRRLEDRPISNGPLRRIAAIFPCRPHRIWPSLPRATIRGRRGCIWK